MSTLVVDVTPVVDNQKMAVGARLKEARAALGLTQKELCALVEMPLPSLRDYELGKRIPGGEAIGGLVRAGINANWLLTGEGPMLLANLQAQAEDSSAAGLRPAINAEVLGAVIEGTLRVVPDAPAHKLAAHIASVYVGFIEQGLLTVDGKQTGGSLDIAA